jgi:hypothetical protein
LLGRSENALAETKNNTNLRTRPKFQTIFIVRIRKGLEKAISITLCEKLALGVSIVARMQEKGISDVSCFSTLRTWRVFRGQECIET